MQWMIRDTASFGKWLEGQPQGQMKDMCIVEFTHEIARDHPDTAEKWVEQMGNEENRDYMFRQIQQKANFSSPEEEKAFADRHGLQ